MYKFIVLILCIISGLFSLITHAAVEDDTVNDFALVKIDIVSSKKLNLSFNRDLENSSWAIRTFKLSNKNDDLLTIKILKNKLIKSNQLEIELEKDMLVSTEYELNVVSIKDNKWNNIKKWINWIIEFKTDKEFVEYAPISFMNENIPENATNIEQLNDNTSVKNSWNTQSNSDNNIDKQQLDSTKSSVDKQSDDVKKLPKTWPEEWIILSLALFLWIVMYILKFSKGKA